MTNTPRTWEADFESSDFLIRKETNNIALVDLPKLIAHIRTIEDEAVRRTETDTLQAVMDWAISNGITHKKSFCALRDYVHEQIHLLNDN